MGVSDGARRLRRREGRSGGKRLVKGGNPSESEGFHQSQWPQIHIFITFFNIHYMLRTILSANTVGKEAHEFSELLPALAEFIL